VAYFAQGSSVSFHGATLGQVLNWETTPAQAVTQDTTNYNSDLVGTGWDSRVLKSRNCTAIEPGTATVTMLGNPGFAWSDVGHKATLTVTTSIGSLSFEATLMKYQIQGAVGELLKFSAEFQYTGG
jgi:hypothetical protein